MHFDRLYRSYFNPYRYFPPTYQTSRTCIYALPVSLYNFKEKKKKRNNKVRPSIKHYHARVIFKLTLEGRILYEYLHLLFLERKRKENFDFPRDSVRDRIEHTWMQVVRPGITRQQLFPRWDLRNPSCVTDESLSLFVSLRPSVSGFQVFSNKNRGRGRKQARVHTHVIHASKHGWCTRNPS